MKPFVKVLLIISLFGYLILGLFVLIDVVQIAENHTFFSDTAFAGRPTLFGLIYVISFMCVIIIGVVFLLDGDHWKKMSELDAALTKTRKTQALYDEAKDDLALTVFDYRQRVKEYKRMINPQPKTKKDGHTTKTD